MHDTAVGLRADLKPRKVVPDFRGNYPDRPQEPQDARPQWRIRGRARRRCPGWASSPRCPTCSVSRICSVGVARWTVPRLLSPAMLDLATRNRTGDMVNELYAARGRDEGIDPCARLHRARFRASRRRRCATTCSARWPRRADFGNYGAGTTLFWVDPERDITFACLSAGVMEHNANTRRFQKTRGHHFLGSALVRSGVGETQPDRQPCPARGRWWSSRARLHQPP